MSQAPVKDLYNQWHTKQAEQLNEDNHQAPWHQMVKPHLGDLNGKKTLEIGCGRGGFSRYLLEQGADLVAADFSDSAVAISSQLLQQFPQCQPIVADIQNIPYPDNTFDVVISLETLEHVPDPDQGLKELVRVTRPGGKVIITTPNYFGLLGLQRKYREVSGKGFSEGGQPINQPLQLSDRIHKLKKLNCQVTVVDGCGHYLYLPKRDPVRIHCLDYPRFLTKWLAAHSLTVAIKA